MDKWLITYLFTPFFSGFPLAIFYRKFIFPLTKLQNHIYFIITGLLICTFNFGSGVIHSLISVVVTYLMVTFLPHGMPLRAASFTFHMVHILAGKRINLNPITTSSDPLLFPSLLLLQATT